MNDCFSVRERFSEYMDGAVSGAQMQSIAGHLRQCEACSAEFAEWRGLQRILASIGPVRPPADLSLRLRVAISQERARTSRRRIEGLQLFWQNSMGPVLARGAAGLATAMILIGSMAFMVRTVASPPAVAATEAVGESTSTPQFLYRVGGRDSRISFRSPVMIEAQISKTGRVYDYRIVSGSATPEVKEQLDNFLLMSHFTPALFYGIPVPSRAILSFTGTGTGKHKA